MLFLHRSDSAILGGFDEWVMTFGSLAQSYFEMVYLGSLAAVVRA